MWHAATLTAGVREALAAASRESRGRWTAAVERMPDPLAPEPPYPADTRARGRPFPLDVQGLLSSPAWLSMPPVLRPWLLRLWVESWGSIPVGSYEDDDALIAARIEMPVVFFLDQRPALMVGWVRHADGRWYHPDITAQVLRRVVKRRLSQRGAVTRDTPVTHAGVTVASQQCHAPSSSSSSSSSEFVGVAKATVEFARGEPDLARSQPAPRASASRTSSRASPAAARAALAGGEP